MEGMLDGQPLHDGMLDGQAVRDGMRVENGSWRACLTDRHYMMHGSGSACGNEFPITPFDRQRKKR